MIKYSKLLSQQENFWRQGAKQHWLKIADSYSKIFTNYDFVKKKCSPMLYLFAKQFLNLVKIVYYIYIIRITLRENIYSNNLSGESRENKRCIIKSYINMTICHAYMSINNSAI